jgi:hypothetical protein
MHYKPKELFEVIVNGSDYELDAVEAANQLILEQGLQNSLQVVLDRHNQKLKKKEKEKFDIVREKEEHLKSVTNYKDNGVVYSVPLYDVKVFEDRLMSEGIEYYRNDKINEFEIEQAPTQNYYFNKKYVDEVNMIVNEIEMAKEPVAAKKVVKHIEVYILVGVVVVIAAVFKLLNIF